MHRLAARDIVVEAKHVKAHRTKQDKKEMSQFELFVAGGNEKADELAKAGAMLDEGFMAEARAKTVQQERGEMHAALQYVARFQCVAEEWQDCEEPKPKPKEKLADGITKEHVMMTVSGANHCQVTVGLPRMDLFTIHCPILQLSARHHPTIDLGLVRVSSHPPVFRAFSQSSVGLVFDHEHAISETGLKRLRPPTPLPKMQHHRFCHMQQIQRQSPMSFCPNSVCVDHDAFD